MTQPSNGHTFDWSFDQYTKSWWMGVKIEKTSDQTGVRNGIGMRGMVIREDSGLYEATLQPLLNGTCLGHFPSFDKAKEACELAYLDEQLRQDRP